MKRSSVYLMVFSVALLLMTGILMVFSASPHLGMESGDVFYFVKRHFFYIVLGLLALSFSSRLNLARLKNYAFPLLALSILLLLVIFVPGVGKSASGASRWIDLRIFSFQPSELAKLALLIYLAATLSSLSRQRIKDFFKGLLPPLCVVGGVCLLLMLQPDMGTAISIFSVAFLMLFLAGAQLKHLGWLALSAVAGMGILSLLAPYRMRRLAAFIDPWSDPLNVGYHIIQSLIAVGTGGLWGVGLGCSKQKFSYLPQQYADFIFAVFCEELGFIGALGLIFLFLVFFASSIKIALDAKNPFNSFLAAGIVCMLAAQTFINLSVVVGLLPTTGIPLPFISYGGTAMIINLFCAGLLINISQAKTGERK